MPFKIKPSVIRAASLVVLLALAGLSVTACTTSGFYGSADVGRHLSR